MKYHFCEFVQEFRYYKFDRMYVTRDDGKKCYGYLYTLESNLTDEQKEKLVKYNNVKLFISECRYAPEIKKSAIFIGETFINKVVLK